MARKEKDGNGARTAEQRAGQRQLQPAEQSRLPARRTEHPLRRLREEMDTLFDRFFSLAPAGWGPGRDTQRFWDLDVEETDQEVVVRAEAPGFEAKDFDIDVSGHTLTIRAEHKHESEEKKEGYSTWERRYGEFQRSVPLPAAVDAARAEAYYRNGVLELHLPRTEEAQRRRIEVKA